MPRCSNSAILNLLKKVSTSLSSVENNRLTRKSPFATTAGLLMLSIALIEDCGLYEVTRWHSKKRYAMLRLLSANSLGDRRTVSVF